LGKSIHATVDADVDKSIVKERFQVVKIDDEFAEHGDGDAHVFGAFHGCA
jgi:hypothetical protein